MKFICNSIVTICHFVLLRTVVRYEYSTSCGLEQRERFSFCRMQGSNSDAAAPLKKEKAYISAAPLVICLWWKIDESKFVLLCTLMSTCTSVIVSIRSIRSTSLLTSVTI